ncbi:glycosyltransferase [Deinococcus koreensis]|uniref:Glycosyltransferase n=1 Tax=Deinococcus koreensis TaxID=2054903 RepID=A0A2K3USV2_9DEIO|nr:nucleotide disphospho-sugar-binding domain-containing protein [Deinococcus koreensis]PNY79598.1 glycosyltransferase [Deinococcus koreensis]
MNQTAQTFLFVLWEGGGNIPPLLDLARRLRERGHAVRVMSDACNEVEVRASGCAFVPYTTAPSRPDKSPASDLVNDASASNPLAALARAREAVLVGPAARYAQDVLAEIQRARPDAVAVSDGLFGAVIAAESAGVPCALLMPHHYYYPAPGLPPTGMRPARGALGRGRDRLFYALLTRLFDAGLPRINALRASQGLAPLRHLFDLLRVPERVLVLTSPAFDFAADPLPANVRYVGPVVDDPVGTPTVPLNLPGGDAPLVAVGFSTTFQNQRQTLQNVIDALGTLPVRGLVTLGPAMNAADFRLPANVHTQVYVPHGQLFPQAALVVTHAGHGTVIRALAHGTPLVCLPMGRDQNGNAVRVAERGLGRMLAPTAPVAAIHAAVQDVLADPGYRLRAAEMAAAIARDVRESRAVEELEALAAPGTVAARAAAPTQAVLSPTPSLSSQPQRIHP